MTHGDSRQAAEVNDRLGAQYPDARCELDFNSAFQLLVATVLSAQSTDRRVNSVTRELFESYPDAVALAGAPREDVERIVGPVGFFRNKTTAIIGLSTRLVDDFDGVVPNTLEELVTLPGVGRKTANVVLGDAFGTPGVTPDTHLIRLSNRLGWTNSTTPDVVERAVGELFDPRDWVQVCHRVIWHGRRCCHARGPACGACVLGDICPSYGIGETDPEKARTKLREPRA
ncbi:MAG: endonuclease III [Propionibacteriaceae bacterium]|nr:endonuclease III [Propionibacteriaceae bacterium]